MYRVLRRSVRRLRDSGRWFSRKRLQAVSARQERFLHDHRLVFVHIPKTAGTSITRAIHALPERENADLRSARRFIDRRIYKHMKAEELREVIGGTVWERYFSFAFVRNPWDLMVSSYHWWIRTAFNWPKFEKDVEAIRQMYGFSEFIRSPYGTDMINECVGTMFDWISADGAIIVDFVGKVETIQRDWASLCQQIGVPPVEMPHENRTEHKPYRDYYDTQSRELVGQRFSREIELFGYTFE